MNRISISLATSFVLASAALGALTGDQLSALKQKLANPDPIVRREALNEVVKNLGKAHPTPAGNDVLSLLCSALADQDAQVRAGAAASLAMISFSTRPKFRPPNENVTDLRSYPPLQAALVVAFDDRDEETRKNALAAYALTFEVPAALQDTLASRYDSERQNSIFRTAILEAVMIDGVPTPAAKALLMRVASDPASSVYLAQMIHDSKAPPVELLPEFATQFAAAHDKVQRAAFARAIGHFGASAKPYLPALDSAATLESDDSTKQSIARAAAVIRAAK